MPRSGSQGFIQLVRAGMNNGKSPPLLVVSGYAFQTDEAQQAETTIEVLTMSIHDIKTLKAAQEIAGKFSDKNSKMPGSTFAISAKECNVGGKLANVKGSVCDRCYALKLQKLRPSVDKGWTSNYLAATKMIAENADKWAAACAFQINRMAGKTGEMFHRWFDSGDLQSVEMLAAIVKTCELTPEIQHWLPTREAKIVKTFTKAGGVIPSNLVIRISSTMIGDAPIKGYANTSTVHRKGDEPTGHICPASQQNGNCGDCRACWTPSVDNVSYPLH